MEEANKQIYTLANELMEMREKKKETEELVKQYNIAIKNIEEKQLAQLMDEQQISKISLQDLDISKSLVYRGGYTKHSDRDAFKFLFDSDNQGALHQYLIVDLAECPAAEFILMEQEVPYRTEYSIHHATLSSILKELIESGKLSTEDIEKYNIYIQPQIKVKQNN